MQNLSVNVIKSCQKCRTVCINLHSAQGLLPATECRLFCTSGPWKIVTKSNKVSSVSVTSKDVGPVPT